MIVNSIVVDTNLIFSALLSKNSKIRDALCHPATNFYAPNFLIVEIFKHKDRLLQSSKLSESEFYMFFNGLIERITFVPLEFIGVESRQKAYLLCHDVDINDIPFISLALELDVPL